MKRIKAMLTATCLAVTMATTLPFSGSASVVLAEQSDAVKSPDSFSAITNDTFFKDKDGNYIYSQGGGIFEYNGKYYWYGVKYAEAVTYPETKVLSSVNNFVGITCYSSTDLVNWTDEGIIATPDDVYDANIMKGNPAAWVGRLGVTRLADGTYALLVQHECDDPDNSIDNANRGDTAAETDAWSKQVLILTSDAPNGHFTWNNRINMKSYIGTTNTGDQTVFVDPKTGQGYLLYSYGRGRGRMYLSQVVKGDDGIVTLTEPRMIYSGSGREGNCMFEYNGKYYVCASDLYGWNASHCYYLVLDSLDDEYLKARPVTKKMELMDGCSNDYCHVSQTGFFYTVRGTKQDTVIFCGDRWTDFADNGDGYNVWCPLSFDENGIPYFNSLSSWKLNAKTGEWKVASDNNYIKNGSFDADRITVTDFVGWNEEILDGSGSITNTKDCVTGKYALIMSGSGEYEEKISQTISTDRYVALDDGIYDFKAMVKNTEGFEDLSLYAKSGNVEYGQQITAASDAYVPVELKNVVVENGTVELGIYAKGNGATVCADDLTFIKSDADKLEAGTLTGTVTGDEKSVGKALKVKAASTDGKTYTVEVPVSAEKTEFSMKHIPEGTYAVTVSGDGVAVKMDAESKKENTIADITTSNTTGTVSGRVVANNGTPLPGVEVVLTGNNSEFTATTDENGGYTFTDINQGSYSLKYTLSGYSVTSDISGETLVAAGFTTVKADTFMGEELGKVGGTVVTNDGSAISGARVIAKPVDAFNLERYTATTDDEGKFSFDSIPGGEYVIVATTTPDRQYESLPTTAGKVYISGSESIDMTLRIGDDKTSRIENSTFDDKNLNGWENGGDAAGYRNGKKQSHGTYDLAPWASSAFNVDTYQTISDLENGYYVVSCMAQADYADGDNIYLYVKNGSGDTLGSDKIPAGSSSYELVATKVEVTDGTLTIGIAGNMSGGKWANIDDFHLGYLGSDISISKKSVEQKDEELSADYVATVPASPESLEEMTLVGNSIAVVSKTSTEKNDKKDGGTSKGGKSSYVPAPSNDDNGGDSNTSRPASQPSTAKTAPTTVNNNAEASNAPAINTAQINAATNNLDTSKKSKQTTKPSNKVVSANSNIEGDNATENNELAEKENTSEVAEDNNVETIENEQTPTGVEETEMESGSSNMPLVITIIALIVAALAGFVIYKIVRLK